MKGSVILLSSLPQECQPQMLQVNPMSHTRFWQCAYCY